LLTADLVEVRRRGDDLSLRPLDDDERTDAAALADTYVGLVRAHVGRTRAQLLEACRLVPVAARRRRLAAGLFKLALDACVFEEAAGLDPAALRAELFTEAACHRRNLGAREGFDRDAVVADLAARLATDPGAIEQALYADLPEAQVLVEAKLAGPRSLVAAYEAGGVQAILLRAVKVRAKVTGASPLAFRQLFRKLKFLRLLHRIEPLPPPRGRGRSPGYEIIIDGPYSLFESVTRYGLQLALAFPAIAACGRWSLEADLRWGKERRPLRFVQRGQAADADLRDAEDPTAPDDDEGAPSTSASMPSEVATLLADLRAQSGHGFTARPGRKLVALPGAGVIAPDVELHHTASGRAVYVEVLGFWSRDAVWQRIELAQKGLPDPVIFAVSKHLRVSEAALPEQPHAALYVYANKLSARALLERAQQLLAAASPAPKTANRP
jgi:predicted nuclease of restriction endonuclease-like RecB superfamily